MAGRASLESRLDRWIPDDSPVGRAGDAQMLLRVTGGNYAEAAALAAISRKESEFGRTSGRFVNNPYGWGVHLGRDVNTAPDIETMSRRVLKGLRGGLYKGSGITTLPAIIAKYAPPSENDTGLYQRQVSGWLRELGVDPGTNIFTGGQTVPVESPASANAGSGGGARRAPGAAAAGSPDNRLQMIRALRALRDPNADRTAGLSELVALRQQQTATPTPDDTAPPGGGGDIQVPPGSLAPLLPGDPGWGSYGYGDPEGQGGKHLAVDWFGDHGTTARSPATGRVVRIDYHDSSGGPVSGQVFGGTLGIRDRQGRLLVMRHIDPRRQLRVGSQVRAGQAIGTPTDWTGSDHIHFETYKRGSSDREYGAQYALNPRDYYRSGGLFR